VHLGLVLDMTAQLSAPLPVRWAALMHDLGKGTTPRAHWPRHHGHEARSAALARQVGQRLRVPNGCSELADVVAREHGHIHMSGTLGAAALLRLFERCDALRRPQRFTAVLLACECDARGRTGREALPYAPATRLPPLLQAALGVDTAAIAAGAQATGRRGPDIGAAIQAARVAAMTQALARAFSETPPAA
jgi:tRNA nucleotidyltransferase (CCA-adding enzyme)